MHEKHGAESVAPQPPHLALSIARARPPVSRTASHAVPTIYSIYCWQRKRQTATSKIHDRSIHRATGSRAHNTHTRPAQRSPLDAHGYSCGPLNAAISGATLGVPPPLAFRRRWRLLAASATDTATAAAPGWSLADRFLHERGLGPLAFLGSRVAPDCRG